MMLASVFLGAALVVASPTNAPNRFSTETEQTFLVPGITDGKVASWVIPDGFQITYRDSTALDRDVFIFKNLYVSLGGVSNKLDFAVSLSAEDGVRGFGGKLNIRPAFQREFIIDGMQADHVTPWSKGGRTVAENCQMLCAECNRRKGGV